MKIILADDHPTIITGVRSFVDRIPGCCVVTTATTSDELIECLNHTPCDLVISDFTMPTKRVGDGLHLLSYIQRHFPEKWLIVLTMNNIPAVLYQIIHCGVNGVLHKSDELIEIGKAIQGIKSNIPYIGSSLRLLLQQSKVKFIGGPAGIPSPRETEVLRLYAAGHSLQDISIRLNKSIKTISVQKAAAMKKLGLCNDVALGRYCAAASE